MSRLTFSQKILSPPALVRNNERLIVAGDASLGLHADDVAASRVFASTIWDMPPGRSSTA